MQRPFSPQVRTRLRTVEVLSEEEEEEGLHEVPQGRTTRLVVGLLARQQPQR